MTCGRSTSSTITSKTAPGLEIASILDEHTRLILDDTVEASITGEDLAAILDSIALEHGFPEYLRMDNGPEMVCNALADWADQVVGLVFIPPGEPWNNRSVESFHSRQPDELSSITTFASLLHARVQLTDWHHGHNHVRRHSSLGYQAPAQYATNCTCTKPERLPTRRDRKPGAGHQSRAFP